MQIKIHSGPAVSVRPFLSASSFSSSTELFKTKFGGMFPDAFIPRALALSLNTSTRLILRTTGFDTPDSRIRFLSSLSHLFVYQLAFIGEIFCFVSTGSISHTNISHRLLRLKYFYYVFLQICGYEFHRVHPSICAQLNWAKS